MEDLGVWTACAIDVKCPIYHIVDYWAYVLWI